MKKYISKSILVSLLLAAGSTLYFSSTNAAEFAALGDALEVGLREALGGAEMGFTEGAEAALAGTMRASAEGELALGEMSTALESVEAGGARTAVEDTLKATMQDEIKATAEESLTQLRNELAENPNFVENGELTAAGSERLQQIYEGKIADLQQQVDTAFENKLADIKTPDGRPVFADEEAVQAFNKTFTEDARVNAADALGQGGEEALDTLRNLPRDQRVAVAGEEDAAENAAQDAARQGAQGPEQRFNALDDQTGGAWNRVKDATTRAGGNVRDTFKSLGSGIDNNLERFGNWLDEGLSKEATQVQYREASETFGKSEIRVERDEALTFAKNRNPGKSEYTIGRGHTDVQNLNEADFTHVNNQIRSGNAEVLKTPEGEIKIRVRAKGSGEPIEINLGTEGGGFEVGPDGKFTLSDGERIPVKDANGVVRESEFIGNDGKLSSSGEHMANSVTKGEARLVKVEGGGYRLEYGSGDLNLETVPRNELPTEVEVKANLDARDAALKNMQETSSNIRKFGRGVKNIAVGTFNKVVGLLEATGMLLAQAAAFTVPSVLYQQTVEAEQLEALRKTIAAPQQFGDLYLQIPPSLISQDDPLRSSFLYCQVPGLNDGNPYPESHFSEEFLRTANFYVTYGGSYSDWGTTYIGSSSFTGQLVNLNTGWAFTGEGVSVDATKPTFPLRPQGPKTVETFTNTFVGKSGEQTFEHQSELQDWIPLAIQKGFGFAGGPDKGSADGNPTIVALFETPAKTGNADNDLPGASGYQPPPLMFANTISQCRSGAMLPRFGGIRLRQMQGTGYLNTLLTGNIDWHDTGLQNALNALALEERNYQTSMENLSSSGDSVEDIEKKQQNAADALAAKQQAVAEALTNNNTTGGLLGFHPQENINLRNIFIYEIDPVLQNGQPTGNLTPALRALYRNKAVLSGSNDGSNDADPAKIPAFIPIKEYMVCLDSSYQIVPLMIPVIKKSEAAQAPANQSGQSDGQSGSADNLDYTLTYEVNPSVVYLASLTTGLSYIVRDSNDLLPMKNEDGSINFSIATAAFNAVTKQLANDRGVLNQIIAMSNYTTNQAVAGPFRTLNGAQLEKVPLSKLLTGNPVAQQESTIRNMSNVLSGAVIASAADLRMSTFTEQEKQNLLPHVYVYRVSNADGKGALSTTLTDPSTGQTTDIDIPDYVVAVGLSSDNSRFQIMPLGIDQVTGSLGTNGVNALFSLVTGRAYDVEYNPLPRWYTVDVIPRNPTSYFPVDGSTQGSYEGLSVGSSSETIKLPQMGADGKVTLQDVQVRMFPNIWLSTAYMPTDVNPYNRIFASTQAAQAVKSAYDAARQTIITNGKKLADLTRIFEGAPVAVIQYVLSHPTEAELKAAGFPDPAGLAAKVAPYQGTDYAQAAQALDAAQRSIHDLQYQMDTQDNPPLLIPRPSAGKMNIPPMYFGFFSNFEVCTSGGSNTYQLPSSVTPSGSTSLSWVDTKPCSQGTPLGQSDGQNTTYIPLMGALPIGFSGLNFAEYKNPGNTDQGQAAQHQYYASATDNSTGQVYPSILSAYTQWMQGQEANKYWVQTAMMGPLNFTRRQKNNVYLSATSRQDVARGNFFYRATGFSPASIFVCATGPADGKVTSIADLQDIGRPYESRSSDGRTGAYLIDVGTGFVYTRYGTSYNSYPDICCYNPQSKPEIAQYQGNNCTLQPVGQNAFPGGTSSCSSRTFAIPSRTGTQLRLDVQKVLQQAFANQGTPNKPVTFSDLTPGLKALIQNAQAVGTQQLQRSLFPLYFKQLQLRLTEKQIADGTYIYAYVPEGGSYDSATDYLVVLESPTTFQRVGCEAITPYTNAMISLVSGTLYESNGVTTPNYFTRSFSIEQPSDVSTRIMAYVQRGSYDPTTQQYSAKTIDTQVAQRIQNLSAQYLAKQQQNAPTATGIDSAPTLTKAQIAAATEVGNGLYSITVNGKTKYLYKSEASIASTSGGQNVTITHDMYFDFNATNASIDANYGVYYQIKTDGTPVAISALSGFEVQAVRLAHGVNVAADGTESLHLPVANLSIPLAPQDPNTPNGPKEATLIPVDGSGVPKFGQDGTYMKYDKTIGKITNDELGQEYYYYRHTQINAYFVLVRDTRGYTVGNNPAYPAQNNSGPQTVIAPAYFMDLVSGDEYDLTGNPRLKKVTGAYGFIQKPIVVEVPFTSAPELPLEKLKAASPVGGAHPDLYLVDGKYYLKQQDNDAIMIDVYGNPVTSGPLTGSAIQYFDFAGNNTRSAVSGSDSGWGSFYQVVMDNVENKEVAVPIDNIKDLPAHNSYPLRNIRLYYGVQVADDGTQSLTDPITQGVNVSQPLFVWGEDDPVNDSTSLTVSVDLDGTGRCKIYRYIPNSTVFKFVDNTGKNITEFRVKVTGSAPNEVFTAQKVTYALSSIQDKATATLAPSGNVSSLNNEEKAQLAFAQGINNAVSSGLILFQLEHNVSPTGSGGDPYTLTEGTLSPKIYTLGGQNYIEGGVKGHTYQTTWVQPPQGASAAVREQIEKDQQELKTARDAVVWGIPFIAKGLGSRQANETTKAPSGDTLLSTPLVGVLNKNTKALVGFIPNSDGQFYTGLGSETPGQPYSYVSNTGFLDAFVSNYPLTGKQSIAGDMVGGRYIAIKSTNLQGQGMQSIYAFDYSYATNEQLAAVKKQVNVVSTTSGGLSLEGEINTADLTAIEAPAGSIGGAYVKGISGQNPRVLYQVPPTAVVQAYYQAHPKTYTDNTGKEITALENYNNTIGQYAAGVYIDYVSGVIYGNDTSRAGYLYPNGLSIPQSQLKVIKDQFGGAIAGAQDGKPVLKVPSQITPPDEVAPYAQAQPQQAQAPA